MFDDNSSENCENSNVMAPKFVDYKNDDRHKSFIFPECSNENVIYQINYMDGWDKIEDWSQPKTFF